LLFTSNLREDFSKNMDLDVGAIVDGKVTGITKFGAFVSLPSGKSGMVHISEVAHTYVSDITQYIQEGQEVKVKVIGIDEKGRINLSIKKATEAPEAPKRPAPRSAGFMPPKPQQPSGDLSFEDRLKQFMQDSESKMSEIKQSLNKKSGYSKRGRK
jgi:S1 RNA binding domain protein